MKILLFQENKIKSPSTRKLSAALTVSYETRYDYNLTIMSLPNRPLTLSTHISNFDDIGQC